jgi:hypothetical protein
MAQKQTRGWSRVKRSQMAVNTSKQKAEGELRDADGLQKGRRTGQAR